VLLGLLAALAGAVVFGVAAIAQAAASRAVPTGGLSLALVLGLVRQPVFILAVALNLVGFVLHLVALRLLPLFLAQAGISASLAVTALLAVWYFGDRLGTVERIAVGAVCVGLAVLSAAAGEAGAAESNSLLTAVLFVGAGVIAVLGLLAGRRRGTPAAFALGFLAGLGFAGSSIATRLVPDLSLSGVLSTPASYALPICGVLAFTLYSLGLQRGGVTAVTTPMIVMQTLTPAALGVLALGDAVRESWLPAAVLGLLVTGAGAVVLGRFDDVREPPETAGVKRDGGV
jgi:drug/metabolite transporter (DMT)-like permease